MKFEFSWTSTGFLLKKRQIDCDIWHGDDILIAGCATFTEKLA